jgi:hypothetical protein
MGVAVMYTYEEIKDLLDNFSENDVIQDNVEEMEEDLRFLHEKDGQWGADVKKDWESETIPLMQFDKLNVIASRVKNRIKQLELNCRVEPFGTDGVEIAKVFNTLIRTITNRSDFKCAVDTANQLQVDAGLGAVEFTVDRINDTDFNDDIVTHAIQHPVDLIIPPNALEPLKWDAAGIKHKLTKQQLIRAFGKRKASEIRAYGDYQDSNVNDEPLTKTIVKFYYKTYVKSQLLLFSNNMTLDIADAQPIFQSPMYLNNQVRVIADKAYDKPVVYGVWLDGSGKISNDDMIKSSFIPIVPFFGNVALANNKIIFKSAIRTLKGMQMYHNYNRMQEIISVDDAIKMPWIGPSGSFDVDKEKWASRRFNTNSFVQFKGVTQPQKPPISVPLEAMHMLSQANRDDLLESAGTNEAAMGNETNIIAAKALFRQQTIAEHAAFEFVDNHKKALEAACTILIDMIPRVFSDHYILKYMSDPASDRHQVAVIGNAIPQEAVQTEDPVVSIASLRMGTANIDINIGQSQDTLRNDLLDQQLRLLELAPEARATLLPEFIRTLAWNDSEKIAAKLDQVLAQQQGGIDPEQHQQIQNQMQQMAEQLREAEVKNQELKIQLMNKEQTAQIELQKLELKYKELENEVYQSKTERAKIELEARLSQNLG